MNIDINKLQEAIDLIKNISASDIESIKQMSVKTEPVVVPASTPANILDFNSMKYCRDKPRSDEDRKSQQWRDSCAYWLKKFNEWGEPLEIAFSREYDPRDYTGYPVDTKVESVDLACVVYREPKVKTLFYSYIYGLQLPSARDMRVKAKQRMNRLYNTDLSPSDDFKAFVASLEESADPKPKEKRISREEVGNQFERQLEWEFNKEGYHVDAYGLRKKYDDEGVDLILVKNGKTTLVQAKAYGKGNTLSITDVEVIYNQLVAFYDKHKHEALVVGDLFECILVVSNGESVPEDILNKCVELGLVVKVCSYLQEWPNIKCIIGGKGEKKYYTPTDQHWTGCNMLSDKRRFWATLEEAQVKGYKPSKSSFKK